MMLPGKWTSAERCVSEGEMSMSQEFDASQICEEPLSAEVLAMHERTIEHLMQKPGALANARLHAANEMQRIVNVCNRLAWRSVPADLRKPSAEEAAALLERLSPEDREKLLGESRAGAAQRLLLARIEEAQAGYEAQLRAEAEEAARRDAEAAERAEFEAFDAAGKEERFQAWRAARA
jgi:hypothetical protein